MIYLAALALAAAFIKRDLRRAAFRLCRIPFEAAASSALEASLIDLATAV